MNHLAKTSLRETILFALFLALLVFLPAGSLQYWQGWLFLGAFFIPVALITVFLYRHDPALLKRRLKARSGGEREMAQKIIQFLASLAFLGLIVVSALDFRFGWSDVPVFMVFGGEALILAGFWIVFLTFRENTYASSIIEVERSQTVISSGPYSVVRHPMYAGGILLIAGIPLALGSWWALLIVVALAAVIVARLLNEEQFLSTKLEGYSAYCEKVRYRLVPMIW